MGREREIEKRFSEDLDRILAGEDVPEDTTMDREFRATLDFARRMSGLGAVPSAQYASRLQARLLQKLQEKEARAGQKHGWLWDLVRSRPVWQIAIVVLLVLVASVVWRTGVLQPITQSPAPVAFPAATTSPAPVPAPTTAPAPAITPASGMLLSMDASTDKTIYRPGEQVVIDLAMRNVSPERLTVDRFPPVVSLMQSDTGQPVYTFPGITGTRILASNEIARVTLTWDQVDFRGIPVTGSFYVELEDLEYRGLALPLDLNQAVHFEIKPAPPLPPVP